MDIDETPLRYASKRERWLGVIVFFLMLISFSLHISAFADICFLSLDHSSNQTKLEKNGSRNDSTGILNNKTSSDISDVHALPLFCIIAQLIWTIVPVVVFDPCCTSNCKSIWRITFKLFICTLPLLLCSELNIILAFHMKSVTNDPLMITIKWLIFIATILLCFWTGTLSNHDTWRGIHGGQIAPERNSPLHLLTT